MTRKVKIEIVDGVEGWALYIDNYRVAGPKPWGGGEVVHKWPRASVEDIETALSHNADDPELKPGPEHSTKKP